MKNISNINYVSKTKFSCKVHMEIYQVEFRILITHYFHWSWPAGPVSPHSSRVICEPLGGEMRSMFWLRAKFLALVEWDMNESFHQNASHQDMSLRTKWKKLAFYKICLHIKLVWKQRVVTKCTERIHTLFIEET